MFVKYPNCMYKYFIIIYKKYVLKYLQAKILNLNFALKLFFIFWYWKLFKFE